MKKSLAGMRKSWTIWFNSVSGALLLAWPYLADNIIQMQPFLGDVSYRVIGGVLVGVNILLRFKTTQALQDK